MVLITFRPIKNVREPNEVSSMIASEEEVVDFALGDFGRPTDVARQGVGRDVARAREKTLGMQPSSR